MPQSRDRSHWNRNPRVPAGSRCGPPCFSHPDARRFSDGDRRRYYATEPVVRPRVNSQAGRSAGCTKHISCPSFSAQLCHVIAPARLCSQNDADTMGTKGYEANDVVSTDAKLRPAGVGSPLDSERKLPPTAGAIQRSKAGTSTLGSWDKKLASNFLPSSVKIDSGWNCTPSIGNSRCRTPMMTPSSVSADSSR